METLTIPRSDPETPDAASPETPEKKTTTAVVIENLTRHFAEPISKIKPLEVAIDSNLAQEKIISDDRAQDDALRSRDIGRDLNKIKALRKTHKVPGTFKEYAQRRFKFTGSNADYLITHADICDRLGADAEKLPTVRQSRAIGTLTKHVDGEKLKALINQVVAENITGSKLLDLVENQKPGDTPSRGRDAAVSEFTKRRNNLATAIRAAKTPDDLRAIIREAMSRVSATDLKAIA